uniref:Uncharacterized protein n=1 Tax=uncultured Nitrospirae bacterium Rifle_16ft_4_minimus_39958 TaxID=1665131 RepID=A0A0H4T880_9BACT|nr:hypothetical protein [uncultured Nitrospirae bacterium Rifle_16ft_4_minimus_39958]
MLQVPVVDLNNNVIGNVDLDEKVFGQPVNEALLHEAVTSRRYGWVAVLYSVLIKGITHTVCQERRVGLLCAAPFHRS